MISLFLEQQNLLTQLQSRPEFWLQYQDPNKLIYYNYRKEGKKDIRVIQVK